MVSSSLHIYDRVYADETSTDLLFNFPNRHNEFALLTSYFLNIFLIVGLPGLSSMLIIAFITQTSKDDFLIQLAKSSDGPLAKDLLITSNSDTANDGPLITLMNFI